jgi:hypothetical protein
MRCHMNLVHDSPFEPRNGSEMTQSYNINHIMQIVQEEKKKKRILRRSAIERVDSELIVGLNLLQSTPKLTSFVVVLSSFHESTIPWPISVTIF